MGAPKAITATAHKLARLIYSVLRYGQEYVDAGAEHSSATVNHSVPEDDQTTTDRQIMIRLGQVVPDTDNTYSVEWHIVDINNITIH